jgi:hypothetical protein
VSWPHFARAVARLAGMFFFTYNTRRVGLPGLSNHNFDLIRAE